MKFLIMTQPDDNDAAVVKIALENLNHQVRLYFTADMPTQQRNSVYIHNDHYQWNSIDDYEMFSEYDYDVVWWRRPRKPHLPVDLTHPNDRQFVVRENNLFYESLTANIAPHARWINPKEAATRANFKLLQLKIAAQCGLSIPVTLFSNDPIKIKEFIASHQQEGVIYKAHCANFWFEPDKTKISYTARVNFGNLPEDEALMITPGIYQKEVHKKFELRVVYFGGFLVAAKLDSQAHPESQLDWRAMSDHKIVLEPYQLPSKVIERIRQFMQQLGIVFGSLDLIVTPEDEYVFLEVNEQGQFLWLEEFNPDFYMLDIFINFLLHKTKYFQWNHRLAMHSLDRYREAMVPLVGQNLQRHIDPNRILIESQRSFS